MNAIAPEQIGSNIKKKILENGVSVHSLEKKAGLKQSAIQNILYGKSKKPSLHLIQSIAKALNCTVSELLGEEFTESSHSEIKEKKKDPQIEFWNIDLYIETINVVNILSKKKRIQWSKSTFFNCVEEVYLYSLKNNKTKPDKHFTDWLIDKNCT